VGTFVKNSIHPNSVPCIPIVGRYLILPSYGICNFYMIHIHPPFSFAFRQLASSPTRQFANSPIHQLASSPIRLLLIPNTYFLVPGPWCLVPHLLPAAYCLLPYLLSYAFMLSVCILFDSFAIPSLIPYVPPM
jgi:hypothetical protein